MSRPLSVEFATVQAALRSGEISEYVHVSAQSYYGQVGHDFNSTLNRQMRAASRRIEDGFKAEASRLRNLFPAHGGFCVSNCETWDETVRAFVRRITVTYTTPPRS